MSLQVRWQVNKNKNKPNEIDTVITNENGSKNTTTDTNNYLHPLSYQLTDRAETFTLTEAAIPEGNENENKHENDI